MTDKYLFLDFDGVLNSLRTILAYPTKRTGYTISNDEVSVGDFDPEFDPVAINALKVLQAKTGFKIVISSSWRNMISLDNIHKLFTFYGWDTTDVIIGVTDSICAIKGNPFYTGNKTRGREIEHWLRTNGKEPYRYLILDDHSDMLDSQQSFFIKVDDADGLQYKHIKRIQQYFTDK